jgi:membrane complex biogenesis BtpA family protein
MPLLPAWNKVRVPVIGMLHAPPLPGSSKFAGDFEAVQLFVLRDAESLCGAGVDGLILENYCDVPFYPGRVPAITVAAMSVLATEVRRCFKVPVGINVLRNDGQSALAVAIASGAAFIRVNVLSGARLTDQGIVQGIAHDLLRERASLGSEIRILADVDVKHSAPLAKRSLSVEVQDHVERAQADAIIVSGEATGAATDIASLTEAVQAAKGHPVLVGSGVTVANVAELIHAGATGLIVGSWLKQDGLVHNPVDPARAGQLVQEVRRHSRAT